MKSLMLGVVLAACSYGFAYYQHINKHTLSVGGLGSVTVADKNLFGDWVKDEWVFALAVPAVLIVGGAALSMKK